VTVRGCDVNKTSCITEEVGVAAMPYAWIQEEHGSKIGWRGLPQFLKANSRAVPRLRHDHLLSNPFPLISSQSQCDLTLYSFPTNVMITLLRYAQQW